MSVLLFVLPAPPFFKNSDNGSAVEEDTQDVEQSILEMLGAGEWEGVAVGFLLAKV